MYHFKNTIPSSEITPYKDYKNRRAFIKNAALGTIGLGISIKGHAQETNKSASFISPKNIQKNPAFKANDPLTSEEDITHYNNFYEFGTDKSDPSRYGSSFHPEPWTITVDGLVHTPKTFDVDNILNTFPLEERIYRMRCVEAWSMVIPWLGFPLSALLSKMEIMDKAKYVAFQTVLRPKEMPGQNSAIAVINWPYVEGLRLDEALHPLTFLAIGLYGKKLPNQNGAPIRLVVPWKYGFKGIKSVTRISLVEKQPPTSWNQLAPQEYGFYANVNPQVDHPRWSQATERIIGAKGGFFNTPTKKTQMFNGYGEEVAHLYSGMDLTKNF